ncbi:hypothetical protein PTH_0172 [Pelotomaculum thermopropionicum SI]|uniref:Addiction module component n=1 Tax=Pelotomaculum thermopropionicum (strain DSM 13744 / JCM 10971 / SI) TaxID=370438 RepID=A5D5Y8_PELTS|nr:hypothetical protein PTH_0172 [Pelotomaculum thermopropionicum SI]
MVNSKEIVKALIDRLNDVQVEALRVIIESMIWPEVKVTPEEAEAIAQGEAEVEAGLGVKAEDVWRELGLSDD